MKQCINCKHLEIELASFYGYSGWLKCKKDQFITIDSTSGYIDNNLKIILGQDRSDCKKWEKEV